MTSEEIRAAAEVIKRHAIQPKECPKCGQAVIELEASPEAARDLAAAGYDGTCCWEGFPK